MRSTWNAFNCSFYDENQHWEAGPNASKYHPSFPFARNSLLFAPFFTPTGNKKANEKETRALSTSTGHDYSTCVNAAVLHFPPPLSSSFIVSPTPSSLSPTKIHTRVNWLNVVCVSSERSEINGNNFQWKKLRRINSFVFVLFIWRISIFKSLVYFFGERKRERDESKTENRILEGNGAELNCQVEIIWTGIAGETVRVEASFRGGEKIRFKDPHLACSEQWIFQRWLYPPPFITLPYLSVSKVPITQPRVREREREKEKENASRLHDSFNPGNRISWTDWREGAKG